MVSFKHIFHAIWYAWNLRNLGQVLFVFLGGLFFLLGAAYYASRDRLPDNPQFIDLDTAHRLIEGASPRYVHLTAVPDFSRRIYRTGSWAPFWGNCPQDQVYEIDATAIADLELNRLLGCRVVLSGRVDIGEARTISWPAHAQLKDAMFVSLVPVQGTEGRIWIRSEVVEGLAVDMLPLQAQTAFSGMLAKYPDALGVLPKGLATQSRYHLPHLPNAFVLSPHTPYSGDSLAYFTSHYWVPVKGSDRLFLWTSVEAETSLKGVITGVLMPLSLKDHRAQDGCLVHFESVTGQVLPERFGIIEYPTAEAYNQKLSGYAGILLLFGVLWTLCGGTGIALYILAPGLIYAAWKRALNALFIWPIGGKARTEPTSEATATPGTKSTPKSEDEAAASEGYHPFMAPFSSPAMLEPPEPRMNMAAGFRSLRAFSHQEKELYLSFVQDFMHPNNPDAGLVLVGYAEEMEAAESVLFREGQRHPGLAMKLLAVNEAPLIRTKEPRPGTLESFDMRAGDYVVLSHAPAMRRIERVVVTAVISGSSEGAHDTSESILAGQKVFAIMGQVFLIGDSEHGPCQRMKKSPGSTLMYPS